MDVQAALPIQPGLEKAGYRPTSGAESSSAEFLQQSRESFVLAGPAPEGVTTFATTGFGGPLAEAGRSAQIPASFPFMKKIRFLLVLLSFPLFLLTGCVHIPDPATVSSAPTGGTYLGRGFSIAEPRGQKWNKLFGSYLSVGPVAYAISGDPRSPGTTAQQAAYVETVRRQLEARYRSEGWTKISGIHLSPGIPAILSGRWLDETGKTVDSLTALHFGDKTMLIHALVSPDGSKSDALRVLRSFRER
jgi:hypothetical protein